MATQHAYVELGLAPGASEPEVKAAWRRLASQWHPDRNRSADAAGRMQRINHAFEVLRDAGFPAQAAAGGTASRRTRARPAPPRPPTEAPTEAPAAAPPASPEPGPRRTITRRLRVSLEEAALGCIRQLRGNERETCADCSGSGWAATPLACAGCAGSGQRRQAGWYGLFGALSACGDCAGSGESAQACAGCLGAGRRQSAGYSVGVRLPAGVRDGDALHVDGRRVKGLQQAADLLIRVELRPHAFFKLDDDGTLHCALPVCGFAWLANRAVPLPTLVGLQSLKLDRKLRDYCLAGEGFPVSRGGPRADLRVQIEPRFPAQVSTDQQILLDQLAAVSADSVASGDAGLSAWQQTLAYWEKGLSPRAA